MTLTEIISVVGATITGLGVLAGTAVYVFGTFRKGKQEQLDQFEDEKTQAASQAIKFLQESVGALQTNLVTATRRLDEATIKLTEALKENEELRKQNGDYKDILAGRDEQTRKMWEITVDYQKQTLPLILSIHKTLQSKNGNIERLAQAIEKHLASIDRR